MCIAATSGATSSRSPTKLTRALQTEVDRLTLQRGPQRTIADDDEMGIGMSGRNHRRHAEELGDAFALLGQSRDDTNETDVVVEPELGVDTGAVRGGEALDIYSVGHDGQLAGIPAQ